MHESDKILEAEYFFTALQQAAEKRDAFKYNLSAFLSAARSVLQYALLEAQARPGGQAWYDTHVAGDPILSFFKDRRDLNIHRAPISVRADINISLSEMIHLSESVSIAVTDQHGNVTHRSSSTPQHHEEGTAEPGRIELVFRFNEWPGPESAVDLCSQYLRSLKAIVADGQTRGFLT